MACATQWKLLWSEEFDDQGLPDPTRWSYEEGFVRNKEEQWYTCGRRENIRVENGMLVIEGRHEPGYLARANYTSASIHTHGKFAFTYGRIEARARLPQGRGVWPAIWMMGENIHQVGWPRCGEIDVMEFVGHTPDQVHGTLHWGKGALPPLKQSSGKALAVTRPFDDFHLYAVEWYPDRLDFFYDDQKYHTVTAQSVQETSGENPFSRPHYLIVNLALGGSWGREIDAANLPQKYLVDYIRVYQQAK